MLPSISTKRRRLSLVSPARLVTDYRAWRESADVLAPLVPLRQQVRVATSLLTTAVRQRISPLAVSTWDLEYNGIKPGPQEAECSYPAEPHEDDGWPGQAVNTLTVQTNGEISNVCSTVASLRIDGELLPATVPASPAFTQAYVVSP